MGDLIGETQAFTVGVAASPVPIAAVTVTLSAADAADTARRDDQSLGPLAGVPFTIKSNIDLAGSPTTFGLSIMKDAVPTLDAPVVGRMQGAGAIPLAGTNMPDLGLRMQTDSSLYGLTKNPGNAKHPTAGSSGGEAVALATGMSPIGLGNDLGGSLRNPASCVGVTSIKPSFGRVPTAEQISVLPNTIMSQESAVTGPMARTVDDVKLGLEILSGPHPRGPLAMPIPLEAKAGRKKVAVLATPPGATPTHGSLDAGLGRPVRPDGRVEPVLHRLGRCVDTDVDASPLLVEADATNGTEGAKFSLDVARPVYPGNVLGLPSAAVPAGTVDGLPVGVLITGPRWSDLTCLEIAEHVEEAGIASDPPF